MLAVLHQFLAQYAKVVLALASMLSTHFGQLCWVAAEQLPVFRIARSKDFSLP